MPNGPELLIVLGVLVLLFGAKKIPELARSVGTSVRELKKGMTDDYPQDVPERERSPSPMANGIEPGNRTSTP